MPSSAVATAAGMAILAATIGCQTGSSVEMGNPQHAALVQMMMPRSIEIQRFLTKPTTFASAASLSDRTADRPADGIEVVLAVNDQLGDEMKAVGSFFFELHKVRPASADRLGEQVDAWEVKVDSADALKRYWDRPSRWYRFPLQFHESRLPPGEYILDARYVSPWDDKLFSRYEFSHK